MVRSLGSRMATPPRAERKVQTAQNRGRSVSSDAQALVFKFFYPHAELETSSELTELERHRNEWD